MKRILIVYTILLVTFFTDMTAQERNRHSIGLQYDIEWVTNGHYNDPRINDPKEGTYAETCFPNYKYSLLYRLYFVKGLFVEPQVSLYTMEYDYHKSRGIGIGAGWPNPDPDTKYEYRNVFLNEKGYSGSILVGYNFILAKKLSMDIFVYPTYSYAKKSTGFKDADLLKEGIYKREYLSLNGGFGLNYKFLFLKFAGGSYLTDRFLENTEADKPITWSLGLGIRIGL